MLPHPPISQNVLQFIGDELPSPNQPEALRKTLMLIMLAWNYSIYPVESKESQVINNNILRMPNKKRIEFERHLTFWVEKKKRLFPSDRRIIVDLDLKKRGGGYSLVASSYDYDNTPKNESARNA